MTTNTPASPSLPPEPDRELDLTREGFQIVGVDWTYIYVNPAAAAHGRHRPRELEGHTLMEMYPGIEHTPLFATLERCMISRQPEVFENEFTFPDGSRRWFEIRVQPVPEGICIYSRDIQDRKEDEPHHQRAEARLWSLWRVWRRVTGSPDS